MFGRSKKQKVKLGFQRYNMIAKSALENLLLQENLERDFLEFSGNTCYSPVCVKSK